MKTALVTGASQGMGYEYAKLLAQDGYELVLVSNDEKTLQSVASRLERTYNVHAHIIAVDLSQYGSAEHVYSEAKKLLKDIDIVINNAGFGLGGQVTETAWQREYAMMQVNMVAVSYLSKVAAQDMTKRGSGKILNVSSTAAFQPGPFMAVYYATKAYVLFFSEALADELQGTGVTVTTVCPGPTRSAFQKVAAIEGTKLVKDKKLPTAEDVALFGYTALQRGERLVIHGFKNKYLVFLVRLLPRSVVLRTTRSLQKPA